MYSQNLVFQGLGTQSLKLPESGNFFIEGKISLPTLTQGGVPSSCLVTVNQNGSPIYTGQAGAEGFKVDFVGVLNDTIAVVFSSALASDAYLNVIKSNISIGNGQ